MDDLREKVISSLETLKQDFPKIISWQYDDQLQNTVGNIELAITLLKAQEPRVMDADEMERREKTMRINEYQTLAARTINKNLTDVEMILHALHGLSAEVGELHGIYQKSYQGHEVNPDDVKKEVGDIMWMVAEFCTAKGWELEDICQMNIDKLRRRYPQGFSEERSVHRTE